jgi:hypothetical protein
MIPRTITADFTGAHIILNQPWGLDTWHTIVRRTVKWDAILILRNFSLR